MHKTHYAAIALFAISLGTCTTAHCQTNAIDIKVVSGPRQTFRGLGASIFPWTPAAVYKTQVTPEQNKKMMQLLWHDAHLRSIRLWIHPGDEPVDYYVDGYCGTGKLQAAIAAGASDIILAPDHIPPAMNDGHGYIRDSQIPEYASILAKFIADFRTKTGILINHCGVLNEPNDRPVKFSDTQWPTMIVALRHALDQHGLAKVDIVAPESANCGDDAYRTVDAIKGTPEAWADLGGIATHSYNNAATEKMAERRGTKSYWITEAGGMTDTDEGPGDSLQAASIASRFLNDVNHGATHWQFFIGSEIADPRGNTARMIKYEVSPFRLTVMQRYWYLKQLGDAFDIGAAFRHSLSSLDGEMNYGYVAPPIRKPHLNAAVASNPDGSWAVGLSNFTTNDFMSKDRPDWIHQQGGYPASTYSLTVQIPELARVKTLRLSVRRSNSNVNDVPDGTVVMHYGRVTVPNVGPLDLITLRSDRVPKTKLTSKVR